MLRVDQQRAKKFGCLQSQVYCGVENSSRKMRWPSITEKYVQIGKSCRPGYMQLLEYKKDIC